MMKKVLILMSAFLYSYSIHAQVIEAKINPLGLIFGATDASVEFNANERIGIEGSFLYLNNSFFDFKYNGLGGRLFGKYYLGNDLDEPLTKYWVGAYLCSSSIKYSIKNNPTDFVQNNRIAFGFSLGHKWLAGDNLIIELAGGAGRAFLNDFAFSDNTNKVSIADILPYDIYTAFKIGWRFGEANSGKKKKRRRH